MSRTKTPPARERATESVNSLVTPTMRHDFVRWAASRGETVSGAVRLLIADVLARDARTASNAAYRVLPAVPLVTPGTAPQARLCSCCGMFHQRDLEPGEHCDWCVWGESENHPSVTDGPLIRMLRDLPDTGQQE